MPAVLSTEEEESSLMWEEPESCARCGGIHQEEEHEMSAEEHGIPWHTFGPLYHGTKATEIEGGAFDPSYTSSSTYNTQRMGGSFGHGMYASTSFSTAKIYAGKEGTVHEVVPHPEDHGDFDYELDPMGGPMGDEQGVPTLPDAAELHSYGEDTFGGGTSFRFPGRMLSKRQFGPGEEPH